MARPLRIEYAGAVYHVTSRGNARESIFRDHQDRSMLLDILEEVNDSYHWLCHAYCLMDNHYHVVIETPDGNLSRGMRQLNGIYTIRFNKRHDTLGHVFQGRYKAILIQKDSHLLEVCRYAVLNPVRAKLAETPEQWRWSSYRGTAGMEKPHLCLTTDWVLGHFGARRGLAQRAYITFVLDGIGKQTIWSAVKGQSILGEGDFAEGLIGHVRGYEAVKEIPKGQRYINRPSLEEAFKNTEEEKRRRNARIVEAVKRWGYSQREIADYLGLHYSTVSRLIKEVYGKMSKYKT